VCSHGWFFYVAKSLNPKYCFLTDCGTTFKPDCLEKMIRAVINRPDELVSLAPKNKCFHYFSRSILGSCDNNIPSITLYVIVSSLNLKRGQIGGGYGPAAGQEPGAGAPELRTLVAVARAVAGI
jgi:hypothetical protein